MRTKVIVPLDDLIGLLRAHYGEHWVDEDVSNVGEGEFDPSRLVVIAVDAMYGHDHMMQTEWSITVRWEPKLSDGTDTREEDTQKKGATTFIIDEYGYKVRRLGDGWYQMECDGVSCPAPSVRTHDWQEAQQWGRVHRVREHHERGEWYAPVRAAVEQDEES